MKSRETAAVLAIGIIIILPICCPCADMQIKNGRSKYHEAQAALENDKLDEAAKLLKKALKFDPDNCEYHWLLGDVESARAQKASIFTRFGKAGSCKKHLKRAVELCPDSVRYLESLMSFYLHAPGTAGGDKEEAERLLPLIYARDALRGCLGQEEIAIENEDYEMASDVYNHMLIAGWDTLNVLFKLGNMFNYNLKNYSQARLYYQRILDAEPENRGVIYQASRTAILSGEYIQEAIEHMQHYLSHPADTNQPSHAAAYWCLGMACEQLGNLDSAFICYESSLTLEPDNKKVEESLKELKKKTVQ